MKVTAATVAAAVAALAAVAAAAAAAEAAVAVAAVAAVVTAPVPAAPTPSVRVLCCCALGRRGVASRPNTPAGATEEEAGRGTNEKRVTWQRWGQK